MTGIKGKKIAGWLNRHTVARSALIGIAAVTAFAGAGGAAAAAQTGSKVEAVQPASSKAIAVEVNGKAVAWNVQPLIKDGTTFVPLREAGKAAAGNIEWDGKTQTATIKVNGDVIVHKAGTSVVTVDGLVMNMSAPSLNIKGTLMLPLRSVTDALKASLQLSQTKELLTIRIQTDAVTKYGKADAAIDAYLKGEAFSGMALVAKDGEVLLRKGYGFSGTNKLNRPDAKSRIASITKSFTAASIMQLVEQGKLSLNDPVSKFVTGIPRGDDITIHMLLSHTSGLPSEFTRSGDVAIEQTIAELRTKQLKYEPGTTYLYSNNGYVLLAYVLEQLSGESYADYVSKHLLTPLGMKNSGTAAPGAPTIQGYILQKNKEWAAAPYYVSQSGTGTLYSTVDDLLKWDAGLRAGKVVSEQSLEAMYTPHSDKNYGYGWIALSLNGEKVVFHNGSGSGYATGMLRNLDSGMTVILLGNHAGMDMTKLLQQVHKLASEQ
ncbi:serine hydrolase [Paenibacillus sp. FSL H8-0537]|uniref:serine hydrolase n=1 Tax=Paenibacillus sp. FSL H8-0537 TaxID=2921399 RepID=UPI0031017B6B